MLKTVATLIVMAVGMLAAVQINSLELPRIDQLCNEWG